MLRSRAGAVRSTTGTCRHACKSVPRPHSQRAERVYHMRRPQAELLLAALPLASGFVGDHQWAQVTRLRSQCIIPEEDSVAGYSGGPDLRHNYTEGLSTGFPLDHGLPAYSFFPEAASPTSVWPYGCFYFMHVDSGIYVNVGRSLRVETRRHAHRFLGIPCNVSASSTCDVAPGDKLYCTMARRKGYDSIQIRHAHAFREKAKRGARSNRLLSRNVLHSELVSCSPGCTTRPLAQTCPHQPMVDRRNHTCRCSDAHSLLNCRRHGQQSSPPNGASPSPEDERRSCVQARETLSSLLKAVEPWLPPNAHTKSALNAW